MERVEPDRRIAFSIWWSLAWRSALALFLIGLARTLFVVLLALLLHLGPRAIDMTMRVVDLFLTLPLLALASWDIVYRLLRRRFKGFEIALVRTKADVDRKLIKL